MYLGPGQMFQTGSMGVGMEKKTHVKLQGFEGLETSLKSSLLCCKTQARCLKHLTAGTRLYHRVQVSLTLPPQEY